MKMYFPLETTGVVTGILLDIRAQIALNMLEKHGLITGKNGTEDSQGRAKIMEMPPDETVKRAFDIAERFIKICEECGFLKPCELTEEQAMIHKANLEHKAMQMRYQEISKHTERKK